MNSYFWTLILLPVKQGVIPFLLADCWGHLKCMEHIALKAGSLCALSEWYLSWACEVMGRARSFRVPGCGKVSWGRYQARATGWALWRTDGFGEKGGDCVH